MNKDQSTTESDISEFVHSIKLSRLISGTKIEEIRQGVMEDNELHPSLCDSRIIVPIIMRSEIMNRIHEGHLGATKCRECAKQGVYWPGSSRRISNLIASCDNCKKCRSSQPLMLTELPDGPWQHVGTDAQFGYSAGEFQALQLIVLATFGVVD